MKGMIPSWHAMDLRLMLSRYQTDGAVASASDVARLTALLGRALRSYRGFAKDAAVQWPADDESPIREHPTQRPKQPPGSGDRDTLCWSGLRCLELYLAKIIANEKDGHKVTHETTGPWWRATRHDDQRPSLSLRLRAPNGQARSTARAADPLSPPAYPESRRPQRFRLDQHHAQWDGASDGYVSSNEDAQSAAFSVRHGPARTDFDKSSRVTRITPGSLGSRLQALG
jgi:hypothetical protein